MNKLIPILLLLFPCLVYPDNSPFSDHNYHVFLSPRYIAPSSGMGFTGFTHPHDENTVSLNPAGLGITNDRFERMSFMYAGVPVAINTPLDYDKFYEHTLSICSQPSSKNIGGFGITLDMPVWNSDEEISQLLWIDEQPVPTGKVDNVIHLITKLTFAYGHNFSFINLENHALGIGCRYLHLYDSNFGENRCSNALSMDFGYSGIFFNRLSLGITFSHIDLYLENDWYSFQEIPRFTGALSINDLFMEISDGKFSLFIESSFTHHFKEILTDQSLWRNEIINTGFELTVINILFIRSGLSYDFFSNDKIVPWGFGLNFFNKYELNFFHTAYATQDVDRKRFGISLSVINLFE